MSDDLNRSLARLQSFDLGELEDVEGCRARWFDMVQCALGVEDEYQLTEQTFMSYTKPVLCSWLAEARDVMARQREMMDNMKEVIELMKIESLSDKENKPLKKIGSPKADNKRKLVDDDDEEEEAPESDSSEAKSPPPKRSMRGNPVQKVGDLPDDMSDEAQYTDGEPPESSSGSED